jgi:putative endonuclease
MCTTYILYSSALDSYYIGYTCDAMGSRLSKHLSAHKGFTARAKDWVVVYMQVFALAADARAHEQEIKKWKSKIRIRQLIERSVG